MMFTVKRSFRIAAMVAACSSVLLAAVPEGWFLAGSQPGDYDCSVDATTTYEGRPSVYLKAKAGKEPAGFGTLMQNFDAARYVGKRVRFSAFVKSDGVDSHGSGSSWAGLWMRIDPDKGFDNMQNRAIKGTTAWQSYSVVLDVPEGSKGIAMGILLSGSGAVWLSGLKFEEVGPEVPATGGKLSNAAPAPTNLNFEK